MSTVDIRELPVEPRALRVIRGYTRCNRVRLNFQELYWCLFQSSYTSNDAFAKIDLARQASHRVDLVRRCFRTNRSDPIRVASTRGYNRRNSASLRFQGPYRSRGES